MQKTLYISNEGLVRTFNDSLRDATDIAQLTAYVLELRIIERHIGLLSFICNGIRTSLRLLCVHELLIAIPLIFGVTTTVQNLTEWTRSAFKPRKSFVTSEKSHPLGCPTGKSLSMP